MNEEKMQKSMIAIVALTTNELTDSELAVLNNVAQLDASPHDRIFDYEKVKALFTANGGTRMHNETKLALAAIVKSRLDC